MIISHLNENCVVLKIENSELNDIGVIPENIETFNNLADLLIQKGYIPVPQKGNIQFFRMPLSEDVSLMIVGVDEDIRRFMPPPDILDEIMERFEKDNSNFDFEEYDDEDNEEGGFKDFIIEINNIDDIIPIIEDIEDYEIYCCDNKFYVISQSEEVNDYGLARSELYIYYVREHGKLIELNEV